MRTQWHIYGVLATWAGIMILIGSSLMVSHWIPLPRPESNASLLPGEANRGWQAYHFLYTECPCSRRVLNHVVKRPPLEGIFEHVVLIGANSELAIAAHQAGYEVDEVTPEELSAKYGVESAPLLVVIDAQRTIRYSGGYTSRKQVLNVQDVDVMSRLLAEEAVEPLPVFGCAVSRELQSIVDPLGLKYKGR